MPDKVAFMIGNYPVRWYGIMIVCGMLAALIVAWWGCKRQKLNQEYLLDLCLLVIPCGILGARLYYVAFNWFYYGQNPAEILAVNHGGLAIHGALLAGLVAAYFYLRYRRQPFFKWLDILAPGVILAQAIGRWGNFFNQEAYGRETDLPWAMYIDGAWRHPTFLYESLWDVAGFIFLLFWGRRKKIKDGDVIGAYFIFYSIGRFFIESLRTDSLMLGDTGIRMAMLISLIGVLVGVALIGYNHRQRSVNQ